MEMAPFQRVFCRGGGVLAWGARIKVASFVRRHASARVRVRTGSILDEESTYRGKVRGDISKYIK